MANQRNLSRKVVVGPVTNIWQRSAPFVYGTSGHWSSTNLPIIFGLAWYEGPAILLLIASSSRPHNVVKIV